MSRFSTSLLLFCALTAQAEERVDFILSADHVLTMDATRSVIVNGAVAVRGERIAAVGTRDDIRKRFKAKTTIDAGNAILMPGLVNTHTHAAMSLLRGIADDLRLQDWLEKFIFPAEARNVIPAFVRAGTRLACMEMLLSGTTTYTDMYYFEEVVAEATKECGMRAVLGQTIIQFPVPDAKTPTEGLSRTERFLKQFANDPLIVPAVAPHALYTNSDATLRLARALANRYKAPLLIHLSETARENDETGGKRGASPTLVLDSLDMFQGRTLAAHGVWLSRLDIETLKARGVGVAHCPSSNMMLASGVSPVLALLKAGIATGLGTDGPAGSNNDFDMFEEMDLAAKLHKVMATDPTVFGARQALEMATIGGARALGLEKEIGSLEVGKRADLIAVSLASPRAHPMYNVWSQIVYALKGSDVEHVMVNGRLLVRKRRILSMDPAKVLAEADLFQKQVLTSLERPQ